MRFLIPCLLLVCFGFAVPAGDPASDSRAKILAPFVDGGTYAVVAIDVPRLDVETPFKLLAESTGDKTIAFAGALATELKAAFLKAGGKDVYVLLNWNQSLTEFLVVVPLAKTADATALANPASFLGFLKTMPFKGNLLAGPAKTLEGLKNFEPQEMPELSRAFAATTSAPVQILLFPPKTLRRGLLEMYPDLPKKLGGGKSSPLLTNLLWAALSFEIGAKMNASMVLQSQDKDSAQNLEKFLGRLFTFLADEEEIKTHLPEVTKLMPRLTPKVQDDRVTLALGEQDMRALLIPLLGRQRDLALRNESMDKLRQIGLAMHTYHDANKTFPPAAHFDAQGQPLLSWRVHLLPFLDHKKLYDEFHLDEPWNSEHNKKLIPQMPDVFRSPQDNDRKEGKTVYLVPTGPKTIFEGKKGLAITKITDGTSNTILALEVAENRAVYWTQPLDYPIDAKDFPEGLVRQGGTGFNAVFADGACRFLSVNLSAANLRALFTANGGEAVGRDQ